jgi:hypothetical protein
LRLFPEQEIGKKRGIIKDDAVGDQPAAFNPDLLLPLRFETQFAKISSSNRPPQLMIILPAIQSLLHIPAQCQRINEVKQVKTAHDIVILPKGRLGFTRLGGQ